jgi:hypothetical protein
MADLRKTAVSPHTMQGAPAQAPRGLAQTALDPLRRAYEAYQRSIGQPFQQAVRGGVRGYFGLPLMSDASATGREAYRQGEALGYTPGIGMPAGAAKTAIAAAGAIPLLTKRIVYHGSPQGPIVGTPRLGVHDETGMMGFSVTRSKDYAKDYAKDVMQRHWKLDEINPVVTKFELKGKVIPYEELLRKVEKEYNLPENAIASNEQIFEYAKKKGIVGVDHKENLGIDEISVLFPEALSEIK